MLAGVIGRMARRRGSHRRHRGGADRRSHRGGLGRGRQRCRSRNRPQEPRSPRRPARKPTWRPRSAPGARAAPWGGCSAGSNVPDLENALTVFELAELKGRGDVQAVVLMLVVFLATQRMYHGPRTRAKAIVIDEAWDLLSGEDSPRLPRRRRETCHAKYRGALVTGTQSGQRLLRQSCRPRRLGELGLGDLPRPEGRIRRAAQVREAHPLRPRHGARAQELSLPPTGAMPSWCCTARTAGASRGWCSTPGRWRCSRLAGPPSRQSKT